jgi:hypothetical protein
MKCRHGKTSQSTDRIARSDCNVAFCRTFLRAVLYPAFACRRHVIDRSYEYRPLIDRLRIWRFAGLSFSIRLLRSMRSVFWPALLMAYDGSPCIQLPVQTDSWCLRHMAGADIKVEFLPYPLTLILDFWIHAVCCAQTVPDRGRSN